MGLLSILIDIAFLQIKAMKVGMDAVGSSLLDVVVKLSTVFIALANLFYIIQFNKSNGEKDLLRREKDRKIDFLKTIVLVPNLDTMYKFLDDVWTELAKLKLENKEKSSATEDLVKEEIEPLLQSLFASFRSDFIIILNATTPSLGKQIQEICDNMLEVLVLNMADAGINLWVSQYFNSHIKNVFEKGKKSMINALFNYDGEE